MVEGLRVQYYIGFIGDSWVSIKVRGYLFWLLFGLQEGKIHCRAFVIRIGFAGVIKTILSTTGTIRVCNYSVFRLLH